MQICWIWQKIKSDDDRDFQLFLDNVQYKSSGILRYERVFGDGFVSTGGIGVYIFVLCFLLLCISNGILFCNATNHGGVLRFADISNVNLKRRELC